MHGTEIALAAVALCLCVGAAQAASPNVRRRGSLANSRIQFERAQTGHVAFIGGSITEMNGYRPLVCKSLERRFPHTKFTFTDAGISSTCSTTGAFRLADHVLARGPVDLFFVEFAVNDDQDAHHTRTECIRAMEGIVRHTRRHNPRADIVFTYFVNPGMLKTLQAGGVPLPIAAHEAVAAHYAIPTIHLAQEVADRIAAGTLTWKQFGGTHPAPHGNALCASLIDELLTAAWQAPLPPDAGPTPHPTPPKPLDPLHYGRGRLIDPATAKAGAGWTLGVPSWKTLKGACRRRFARVPLLCGERPGAELRLAFTGTAVGAYVLAGPDAGTVEARIDGGEPVIVDLTHRFSARLHYPRTVIFAADLAPGPHTLVLRIADRAHPRSTGHAVRILHFVAN